MSGEGARLTTAPITVVRSAVLERRGQHLVGVVGIIESGR